MSQQDTNQAQYLEEAFDTFNRMSMQLESSYRDLEDQVNALHKELAAARSERLKQLAEKERLADRLERLLGLLPGAVLVVDGEGIIKQTNPMAETLLEDKLTGKSWAAVQRDHFLSDSSEAGEVQLRNGKHVTLSMQALDAEPGQVVLIMDISDQHELKAMLNRQDRLAGMGEMAARLAHQIRTPLTTALLYATNCQTANIKPIEQQRMNSRVVDRLKQLEHMVNDMLRFTRGGDFVPGTINLKHLLDEFAQIIEPQLEQINGYLKLPEFTQLIEIQGDQAALLSALLNLADNAMQAADNNVTICLELITANDEDVSLIFRDNGPGISEDIRQNIFTPFFTTKSDGTGLGLAVVHATLQAHKGDIKLLNKKDKGAWFEIHLPLADAYRLLPSGSNTINYCEIPQQQHARV